MASHHILIVEDERELARMLTAGLKTLDADIQVLDVPSGEEALLVAGHQPVDLLILDIHLPGISGLTSLERFRAHLPDVKTILVTGSTDHKIRRQVANAGADAFFFKPVELTHILDAVTDILGLAEPQTPPLEPEGETPDPNLTDVLADLRQETDAISVLILDERGQPLIQAGDLPDITQDPTLISALMGVFSASEKVSGQLGVRPPVDLLHFPGPVYDLYLMHLGPTHALLAAVPPSASFAEVGPVLIRSSKELQVLLVRLGVLVTEDQPPTETSPAVEKVVDEEDGGPELEAIFFQASEDQVDPDDVETFWDTAQEKFDTGSLNPDALSYDQARKLGLAPNDE